MDVTDHLTRDASTNVLAIRVQSTGSNSRWYAGAGIFRHVHIGTVPAVHALTLGGVGVVAKQSDINLAMGAATVTVSTAVHNAGTATATATVSATVTPPPAPVSTPSAFPVALPLSLASTVSAPTAIPAGATVNITQTIALSKAQLWSPDSPSLYSASISISTSGCGQHLTLHVLLLLVITHRPVCCCCRGGAAELINVSFGIRHISFDSTDGFKLNGVVTKLKGGCVHHDNVSVTSTGSD